MSTKASNWVWELEDLGPAESLVLLALADQANDAGRAWPAQGTLARRARQSDRNVRRMLVKLERMGLLTIIRRSSTRGRRSNEYQLHIGAAIRESLESGLPDNLSGSEESRTHKDASIVHNGGIPTTGQSVPLRNRTDCPVAQPDTGVLQQPDTGVRLHRRTTNRTTRPDLTTEVTSPAAVDFARVGSGRSDVPVEAGAAPSAPVVPSQPEPGEARQSPPTEHAASSREAARPTDEVRRLIAACLPTHLQAMDASGAQTVADLLEERLHAGWPSTEIRRLMDQELPLRVHRLSALVAARLRSNVVPELAPTGDARRSDDELWAERKRRSEELAAPVRSADRDPAWEAAWRQVQGEMAGASRLELAQAAHELVARWAREVS